MIRIYIAGPLFNAHERNYLDLEVANLIAVVGGDATAHEVRQRARCNNCGVKGNNTYQIVYTGNSSSRRLRPLDVAMDGAANTHASPADTFQN